MVFKVKTGERNTWTFHNDAAENVVTEQSGNGYADAELPALAGRGLYQKLQLGRCVCYTQRDYENETEKTIKFFQSQLLVGKTNKM